MLSPSSGNTVIKSKLISRRMFLLTAAKAVVMVGIIGRLVSLQINERTKYKTLSDKNRFREWKLAPERGVIKDFYNKDDMNNLKITKNETGKNYIKNNFVYNFFSSLRQKINDPLGQRVKKRKEISQR